MALGFKAMLGSRGPLEAAEKRPRGKSARMTIWDGDILLIIRTNPKGMP